MRVDVTVKLSKYVPGTDNLFDCTVLPLNVIFENDAVLKSSYFGTINTPGFTYISFV